MTQARSFTVPLSHFKREYLTVPDELAECLGAKGDKIPLHAVDDEGKEYILDLYPRPRGSLLGGLGEWYRHNEPGPDSAVTISVLPDEPYAIRLTTQEAGRRKAEGLLIGRRYNMVASQKYELGPPYYLPIADLLTHVFICGVTGSGKTVLGKGIIEEAALRGIPSIVVDLKGDLSSLAIKPSSLSDEEFTPWVEAADEAERSAAARETAERYRQELATFELGEAEVREFYDKVEVRIYTPRSSKGIPVSFASQFEAPENPRQLYAEDRETFDELVKSLTEAFVDRLYPNTRRPKIENERNYLYEIVHHAWLNGVNLSGQEGLHELLSLVDAPPFESIGGLPVWQYIDEGNRRRRLLNKINTLLSGPERMWFTGQPLDVAGLLGAEGGRTPVNILNLSQLDHFEDISFVVAQVTYKIYEWMRKQGGTESPRLVFFIDEIGGGGGKQALFPSYPYECAAKWGLNLLLRQGRAFGVCCLFATQNPGDVDYKGLGNCGTWMIGTLSTDRDRKKVLEGMAVRGQDAEWVKLNLTNAKVGEFVVRGKAEEKPVFIKERWLYTYHRVLTPQEVALLTHGRAEG